MTFLDKIFCASPKCKNECGRKMTKEEKKYLKHLACKDEPWLVVSHAYFCGEPEAENTHE